MALDFNRFDLDTLRDELTDVLRETFQGVADGAEADLEAFGKAIAEDTVKALQAENPEECYRQIRDQIKVLTEIHRVRLAGVHLELISRVVKVLGKAAMAGMLSAVAL